MCSTVVRSPNASAAHSYVSISMSACRRRPVLHSSRTRSRNPTSGPYVGTGASSVVGDLSAMSPPKDVPMDHTSGGDSASGGGLAGPYLRLAELRVGQVRPLEELSLRRPGHQRRDGDAVVLQLVAQRLRERGAGPIRH